MLSLGEGPGEAYRTWLVALVVLVARHYGEGLIDVAGVDTVAVLDYKAHLEPPYIFWNAC